MKIPNWNERPWKNIDRIIIGFTNLIDGAIAIFTLGFYYPWLHSKYVKWRTMRSINQNKRM